MQSDEETSVHEACEGTSARVSGGEAADENEGDNQAPSLSEREEESDGERREGACGVSRAANEGGDQGCEDDEDVEYVLLNLGIELPEHDLDNYSTVKLMVS